MSTDHLPKEFPDLPLRATEGWDEDDLRDFAREYGQLCYEAGVAAERERCAKVAEVHNDPERSADGWEKGYNHAAKAIAAAIRKG